MKADHSQLIKKLKLAQEDDISSLRNKHAEQMEGIVFFFTNLCVRERERERERERVFRFYSFSPCLFGCWISTVNHPVIYVYKPDFV